MAKKTVVLGGRIDGNVRVVKVLVDDLVEFDLQVPDRVLTQQDLEAYVKAVAAQKRNEAFFGIVQSLVVKELESGNPLAQSSPSPAAPAPADQAPPSP